ncbi:hypothetical protein EOA88_00415 [Mesorhizobium sp. M5C.F.Ca.IN.020.14.1.1]|nr:hypothetical protein EOA88_00415 [Mesorhizobium sp. M5C.F.Ca.IN.020.14.1.1]
MDTGGILTIAAPIAVAIVTALGTVYIARLKTKQDIGASITTGFEILTDQLQEERLELSEIIAAQRRELADRDITIRRMDVYIQRVERLAEKAGLELPRHDPF